MNIYRTIQISYKGMVILRLDIKSKHYKQKNIILLQSIEHFNLSNKKYHNLILVELNNLKSRWPFWTKKLPCLSIEHKKLSEHISNYLSSIVQFFFSFVKGEMASSYYWLPWNTICSCSSLQRLLFKILKYISFKYEYQIFFGIMYIN